jgi:hypothetical protein
MPSWKKIVYDFGDDPGIVIASLDCEKNGKLCNKFGVRGYPTFFSVFRTSMVRPQLRDRTYQAFMIEVNRLKELGAGQFSFAERLRKMKYPVFVFRISKSDSARREIATRAAVESNLVLDSRFTFDFDDSFAHNSSVMVLFSSQVSHVMIGKFDYEHISQFIGDNPIVPFGDWTLAQITKVRRLFAVCLPASKETVPAEIVDWGKKHEGEVLFGNLRSIGKGTCVKVFQIASEMQPAVVFINISASTFHVVKAATPASLDRFLVGLTTSNIQMEAFELNALRFAGHRSITTGVWAIVGAAVLLGTSYLGWFWWQTRASLAKVE